MEPIGEASRMRARGAAGNTIAAVARSQLRDNGEQYGVSSVDFSQQDSSRFEVTPLAAGADGSMVSRSRKYLEHVTPCLLAALMYDP